MAIATATAATIAAGVALAGTVATTAMSFDQAGKQKKHSVMLNVMPMRQWLTHVKNLRQIFMLHKE